MVSFIFGSGQAFAMKQYVSGSIITVGIAMFNLTSEKSNKESQETSLIGFSLLITSLFCDGMLAVKQTEVKNKYKPSAFDQMESNSKWCFLITFMYSVCTLQIIPFVEFCSKYPAILPDLLMLAILGTLGQWFVYYTLVHFSSFLYAILATTRKIFTVIASIVIFNYPIHIYQWFSILFVFSGIILEISDGKGKKHGHVHEKKLDEKREK